MSFFRKTEEKGVTSEEIRNLILELNLPLSILELYDGCCKNFDLQDQFKSPYAIFSLSKKQQKTYFVDRYKPLLDFYFNTILAYDIVTKKYVTYSIELFDEKLFKPMSWDSIFIPNIILWRESEELDETILDHGKTLGLKHTNIILDAIKRLDNTTMSLRERSKSLEDLRIKIDNLP